MFPLLCVFAVLLVFSASALDKACPFKPTDLIFVLDGSGSEGVNNFNKQLLFVSNFSNQFEIGLNNTRVALVPYATQVTSGFNLQRYHDNDTLLNKIEHISYPNGETNTHLALNYVRTNILHGHNAGAERNVSKIVFVLTDGQSLEPALTKIAAAELKKNPLVTVVAVGIGSHVDDRELLDIASDANHTFRVVDFDGLESIRADLTEKTCDMCNDMSDICFVLDSSGSEGSLNFHKQLEFVNMIVNEFSFEGQDNTKVCVVTYSTHAKLNIKLNAYNDAQSLMDNILRIPYIDGETMTNEGMSRALDEILRTHDGARVDANKVMIVITDGRSTEPERTTREAQLVHRRGIDTFAIGIGPNIDGLELDVIASDHAHSFRVKSFNDLEAIHQSVVDSICAKSRLRTTTTTTTTTTTHAPTTPTTTLPPTTTKAACGLKPADIVFVLDSSDSEGADNFQREVDFVYNFAAQFSIGVNSVQFSVVSFSSDVQNVFYFNDHKSRHDVLTAIRNDIPYLGTGTNTSFALEQVRLNNLDAANGARTNSSKFVIVVTDGRSDDPDATSAQAHELQKEAEVISIGIGPRVDKGELAAIASNHRVLQVETFQLLKSIKNQLTDLACQS
ncbi:collagen alpha-1(XII) chain-like [Mya arenaria]|uniref:collagen alpha-1(XII) chain-like n=1 Tax=Mya arenaria TaxID=6604 RepID=UPI0022E45ADD|nr:collagen alpha-1(XII) chain-like [Mya arenaria]